MSKGEKGQLNFATRAIHSGQDPTQWSSRAMVPPIVHSTIFNTVDFVSEYHDVSMVLIKLLIRIFLTGLHSKCIAYFLGLRIHKSQEPN